MTIEVDANYFRKNWVERSHGFRNDEGAFQSRATAVLNDDARYEKLRARIERLHESFDNWCDERIEAPLDVPAVRALAEIYGVIDGTERPD